MANPQREDWKKELKNICINIPIEINQKELVDKFREYLHLRRKKIVCKICEKPFYAHSWGEIRLGYCKKCLLKRKKKTEINYEEMFQESKRKRQERENRKIDNFNKGYGNTPAQDLGILQQNMTEEISNELRIMEYKDFLNTHYWKIISRYVRYRQEKCQLCGSKNNLNVHHKDYKERGKEYLNWESSLILLCKGCHAKFHDKMEELK